jgi:cytidyltransferase-like protein
MPPVIVSGGFDDLRSAHVRFLQEASKRGPVRVLLWPDEAVIAETGRAPKFSFAERKYFLEAVRFVQEVHAARARLDPDSLPTALALRATTWAVTDAFGHESEHPRAAKRAWCAAHGLELLELSAADLSGFPLDPEPALAASPLGRAVATGSFDWLHTGHVRFFEEAAACGELTVVVGHDANIRLLKGEGHPRFSQEERRYMVAAVRYVAHTLISTGSGWLDAEPELRRLAPRMYIVNEDGDKPEKRGYCAERGIQYVVLKRAPREGLPRRTSTDLRGF